MNRSGQIVAGLLTGASVLVGVGVYLYDAPVASADIGGTYVTTSNASDPFVMECNDPQGGFGLCLYTSQDLGVAGNFDNPYPMRNTLGFFSSDGLTWSPRGNAGGVNGQVFTEGMITVGQNHGFVPSGANHLWAPSVARGDDQKYYLYVSDVSDASPAGMHTSMRTSVSQSSSPFGPFVPIGTVHWDGTPIDSGAPYMNHPEVFNDGGQRSLIWHDGDGPACGGLAIAQLQSDMMTVTGLTWRPITINGVSALGISSACSSKGRPYLEAPTLFHRDQLLIGAGSQLPGPYTLVFSAKPNGTPTECTSDKGQPGTNLSVIAYATGDSPTGPFTYRGILMCGSSTQWTNHATFALTGTATGSVRFFMIYHDGPAGTTQQRKLHAECLYHGGNSLAAATRTVSGFTDCKNGVDGKTVVFRSRFNGALVSAPSSGAQLNANRWAAGPWERFDAFNASNQIIPPSSVVNIVKFRARSNSRYVCAYTPGLNVPVRANTTSISDPCVPFQVDNHLFTDQSFTFHPNGVSAGYIQVGLNGSSGLYASSSSETTGTKFDMLTLGFPD
jgi:hypothetical protein